MSKTPIEFQAHPPERRRHQAGVTCNCGCCCCCCLHSLGSLIGASVAATRTLKPPKTTDDISETPPVLSTHLGTGVYWKCLGALIFITGVIYAEELSTMLLVLLLAMPGIQLGASVLSLIVLAFSSSPERSLALRQVWRVTIWTVLGGLIGIAVMAGGVTMLK